MIPDLSVTQLAFYCAGLMSTLFAITLSIRYRQIHLGNVFCLAAFVNAAWLISIGQLNPTTPTFIEESRAHSVGARLLLLMEMAHYGAWAIALTVTAQSHCRNCIPALIRFSAYALGIIFPLTAAANLRYDFISGHLLAGMAWSGILFSILCLLILEQLYRNLPHDRVVRLICLALALIFLFDAFLYSQNLVVQTLNQTLWQVRASISLVTFICMSIGVITLQSNEYKRASISFSQPAIFYTTSLTISGFVLLALATGGYYVKFSDASWATVIYAALAALGIILIVLTFSSDRLRRKLNVFINKHLFNYKYDYRNEWLKLIRLLSQPTDHNESAERAITAAAELFRCGGGALWQKRGSVYTPTGQLGSFDAKLTVDEPASTQFARTLETGWIFAPGSADVEMARNNEILPDWVRRIPDIWLVFPLLVEDDMNGFMVLTSQHEGEPPNWEDLDLVKTVGRQIANYIARHEQSELLAQARQFETFNKLSAFVMHDIKNLIAQQSLVVKNAEKHKDNPAFVDDAISTINNSVDRMNNLLRKLRQNEPEETKVLKVKDLLIDAVKRCQKTLPAPTLSHIEDDLHVKADFDSLVMVFTHLIHNAQDATPASGFIDVYVEREDGFVTIHIEDNGEGMTEEFIRHKLFQPFESTKAGKGMGVGVYQAREYIENLGGEISVVSSLGQGTTFTLKIPTAIA